MKDILRVLTIGGVFLVPFIVLIVIDGLFFPYITGKNFIFRIVVEILFAGWMLLALYDKTYRPRFSYILAGLTTFVGVMFLANAFGAHPETSWWSNFERMEGYVTIVHLFLYFIVAGSVLNTQNLWSWFWHLSLIAATFVSLGAASEYFSPGNTRVAGVLGNAAYLAIYMLFHIFLVLYLFVRNTRLDLRVLYAVLGLLFVFILLQTGTRGTAIGMAAGLLSTVGYIALFAKANPNFRKLALVSCASLLLIGGGFWFVKDYSFIQTSPTLSRIANIDLQEDLEVRMTLWNVAWQGVKERPVLGWGQGNFTYVFDKYYDPFLYDQEQWFDRTHNIIFDWLIAGGVVGLIAYLSILLTAVYYLLRRQGNQSAEHQFSVLEQAVLLGLLVGYFTHNLVVFDNIVSYIFLFSVLAMLHHRVGEPIASLQAYNINKHTIHTAIAPGVILVCGFSVYYFTVPHWSAASSIIDAIRPQTTAQESLVHFRKAIRQQSFAEQEVTEQLAQKTLGLLQRPQVSTSLRNDYIAATKAELEKLVDHKPNASRIHIFRGTFYRTLGDTNEAKEAFAKARSLSPQKPSIVLEQGVTELSLSNVKKARDFFAEALALDDRNIKARTFYATTLFLLKDNEKAEEVLRGGDKEALQYFASNEYFMQAAASQADTSLLIDLYEAKNASGQSSQQDLIDLAVLQYEIGELDKAISTLQQAKEDFASSSEGISCVINNLKTGNDPNSGCSVAE